MPKNNSEEIVIENINNPVYKEISHEYEEDENINHVHEDTLKRMVLLNTEVAKNNKNMIERAYIIMFLAIFIIILVVLNIWDSLETLKQKKN